ncbi:hypothetical protein CDD81_2908 [Ophiocordyceps australis]|uniref:Rab-GAP TBC domain-containing protein n=1 Tax=Ophiocordyceps australis TaxID=1399860 RepID=A0A2C5XCC4_9HYPO|nr:hypothetical protein CDD81_2908 [Ophiocordyceps australis]
MDGSSECNSVTRSVSQSSAQSQHSTRRTSRTCKAVSHGSSSASSTTASDKSLTSFPSFSPANGSRQGLGDVDSQGPKTATQEAHEGEAGGSAGGPCIVDSLTGPTCGREALFEDTPLRQSIPGALHQADDGHIERLVARHGAVALVRRIAEDLAVRDSQMAALRRRADERERALRRIVRECGLSNLHLEGRLRAVEQELRCRDEAGPGQGEGEGEGEGLRGLMSEAMQNTLASEGGGEARTETLGEANGEAGTETLGETLGRAATVRASAETTAKRPLKGWKGYLWGSSRTDTQQATGSGSDASSMDSGSAGERKTSTWLGSLALRLVAGRPRALEAMERSSSAKESYGPVEMDAILPPESQPPTLSHLYQTSNSSLLTDRFGFIYDERRKKRQREAAEVAQQGSAPAWQDHVPTTTGPTELLSHTPSMKATQGGLVPLASPTTRAVDSMADGARAQHHAEPVRLLLAQLSEAHDSQQRDKTAKWNDFLRKVRAERRREGQAAAAAAAQAAQARFQQPAEMLPETRVADGEVVGIAGLGIKGKVGRAKWSEFKALVLAGIPVAYRSKLWSECSGATALRLPGYYADLLARSRPHDDALVMAQIQMDIHRTLTDNIFFRNGPGVDKLNHVLVAYSRRNPEVGYCQGMNLIAANLLLVMASAEDAFWVLASMIEKMLPRAYYDQSLMASRADQQVLRHYVATLLPRLSAHLDALAIELEALTFQWFLSVFTDCLSAEALFRVWDVLLCTNDGATFMFQVALALLKLNEANLLQRDTPAAH